MITQKKNSWFVCPKPNATASLRLFCFPFSGGGIQAFQGWSEAFPELEVIIAQYPGRGVRLKEKPYTSLKQLVSDMIPDFQSIAQGKPFAIFGHSLGAYVGYELAHVLREDLGLLPIHLFVSGRNAPHCNGNMEPIHDLPEAEFIDAIKRYNGTPHEVLENKELMELFIPILRADFAMCETYEYTLRLPLMTPITVLNGDSDPFIEKEYLEKWTELTTENCSIEFFKGDHFYLNESQRELFSYMKQALKL